MKELCGTARNYMLTCTGSGYMPRVELILVITEPEYLYEDPDKMKLQHVLSTLRLGLSRRSIGQLMLALTEIDDEMAALEIDAAAATKIAGEKNDTKPT